MDSVQQIDRQKSTWELFYNHIFINRNLVFSIVFSVGKSETGLANILYDYNSFI